MYTGRFAPSPTGPLHLGSLLTALASWLWARHAGGEWLVRIEDLDPPREPPGAALSILASLRAHGLSHPSPVLWQSTRCSAYDAAVRQLLATGEAFHCTCSRQDLLAGDHAAQCPQSVDPPSEPAAVRVKIGTGTVGFDDEILGKVRAPVSADSFVVQRRDGLYSYHLAVVVDDAFQRVSHIVRGRDLLDSTPYHLRLQELLGLSRPTYAHLPLLLNEDGQKLSKQAHAAALDDSRAHENIRRCLRALGQTLPPADGSDSVQALLDTAIARWEPRRIPRDDVDAASLPG